MVGTFEIADLPKPIIRYGVGLWRKRWTVAVVAWAVALLGWFGLWLIPDKYVSRAQVYVQTETVLDPVMSGVTARPNYEKRVEVMRLQLLSRPNLAEIIARSGLDKEYVTASNARERRVQLEKLIDWVSGAITISSPQEMYFDIRYANSNPVLARNVVDAALNMLIEQDLGASFTENEEARKRLDSEVETFGNRLTAKEREVAAFRRRHADELGFFQGNDRRRDLLETDLSRVNDDLALATRRVGALRSQIATTTSQSTGGELDQLKVQLAGLRSQYNEDYPDISVLKARIAELEAGNRNDLPTNPEFKRLNTELRSAKDIVAGLEDRRSRIQTDLDALDITIGQAPAVVAELQRIERDYEQTRKNYEELLQRRDRLAITANLGAGSQGVEYKVFERPQISLVPSAPPRLILILLTTFMALGAGFGAAILFTWLQRSFSQESELQEAFGLPVLGAMSEVNSDAVIAERRRDILRLGAAAAALAAFAALYVYWEVFRIPTGVYDGAASASLAVKFAANGGDGR